MRRGGYMQIFKVILILFPVLVFARSQESESFTLKDMLLIKDVKTGEFRRPSKSEAQELLPINPLSRGEIQALKGNGHSINGERHYHLNGTNLHMAFAKRGLNGRTHIGCVHTEEQAKEFFSNNTTVDEVGNDKIYQ